MRKGSVLFVALLLPVLIFLLLRIFGKNEFSLPVFHEQEITVRPSSCDQHYTFPYRVPHTSAVDLAGVTVIIFSAGLQERQLEESVFQLSRLKDRFMSHSVSTIWVDTNASHLADWGISPLILDSAAYDREVKCVYLLQSNTMVLVDSKRQIRGYYQDAAQKETDRLIMELKILLDY